MTNKNIIMNTENKETRELRAWKSFKFVYNANWTETEILGRVRARVIKDPLLYTNNNFGSIKPLKNCLSFAEFYHYIQSFNFEDRNYPLYYSIILSLENSYRETVTANTDKSVIVSFESYWQHGNNPEPLSYEEQYKMPYNYRLYWRHKMYYNKTYDNVIKLVYGQKK